MDDAELVVSMTEENIRRASTPGVMATGHSTPIRGGGWVDANSANSAEIRIRRIRI